jgi:hypothetical protein
VSTIAPGNCDVYATHEAFDDFDVHDVQNSHDDYSCDVPYRLQINCTVVKIWPCEGLKQYVLFDLYKMVIINVFNRLLVLHMYTLQYNKTKNRKKRQRSSVSGELRPIIANILTIS